MAGIDLGTTNSAIATMEAGQPRLVRISPTEPLLPSAVFIDKRGATYVGSAAREATLTLDEDEGTGYTAWKKRMGQDDPYDFPAANMSMTATQLSAAIIRELLRAYRRETQTDLLSCVITVPAKFDQSAYQATSKAAELAGLKHFPLLQEPIAAVLAYGFTRGDRRANWMVFDLGGGTLDVSLIAVREGKLVVLKEGQAGDPNLGGTNFDRELLDFVLGPKAADSDQRDRYRKWQPDYRPLRDQYKLDNFSEKTHRTSWNRLLLACEQAKIELSRKQEAVVELDQPLCLDERGREVMVEVPVTREVFEKLIASDVDRAVHICQMLLSQNRMSGRDLDELILVGGPTKTPYVRAALGDGLGIELRMHIDPMLAVAQGAALHSEGVDIPAECRESRSAPSNGARIQLQYERSSRQPVCTVAGVVEAGNADLGHWNVEIRRDDNLWNSGQLPLDETGFFFTDVTLIEHEGGHPCQSLFTTRVVDGGGRIVASVDEPRIWHPFPKVNPTLANSLSVATVGNATVVLAPQGEPLPTRKSGTFQTAQYIRKGSSGDVLAVPVVQATTNLLGAEDTEHADCHLHMGSLTVSATDERMAMDLPKGADVDVTFQVDQSQHIKVTAYVPLLDEEFEATVSCEPYGLSLEEIRDRFSQESQRLRRLRELEEKQSVPAVREVLNVIDRLDRIRAIEIELTRSEEGETSALSRALKGVLELAATLNAVWPKQAHVRITDQISQIRKAATDGELVDVETLHGELAALDPEKDRKAMERLESEVEDFDVRVRHRPFYSLLLYVLALGGIRVSSHQHDVHNRASALGERLINNGAPRTLTSSDLGEVERMNREIREAYPDLQEHLTRFHQDNPDREPILDSFGSTLAKKQ